MGGNESIDAKSPLKKIRGSVIICDHIFLKNSK